MFWDTVAPVYDIFANIVNCAMLGAFILAMPQHPDLARLMVYYASVMMTKPMLWIFRKNGKMLKAIPHKCWNTHCPKVKARFGTHLGLQISFFFAFYRPIGTRYFR